MERRVGLRLFRTAILLLITAARVAIADSALPSWYDTKLWTDPEPA